VIDPVKKTLRQQLSISILVIILITIIIIGVLANYFINRQFTEYIAEQQGLKTQIITSSISNQYSPDSGKWNLEYIHAVGMNSLYEGYIIKVYDKDGDVLWDAQSHDMSLCNHIMNEISSRMEIQYTQLNGKFKSTDYPLLLHGEEIGSVSISYFGPFFLNENDFEFLHSLNIILFGVCLLSLILSAVAGHVIARRITRPILKTVDITKQIADGNYEVRLEENSNAKELNLLVDSINHLAESLKTLEKLRKQLTEDVAHELRTPITILQSYLEAMTEGVWDATGERLNSCYEETVRIEKLVGDLEKLAKIESDNLKLDKTRINLLELAEKTVQSFQGEITNKQLVVKLSGTPAEIIADQDRIRQVMVNLLSNAVKYSGEGGIISFEVFETEDSAGFYIKDTGIGIPQEELPFIFERFYRADKSRNRSTGGSGIGLTIVKSIVEAHGGRVLVESSTEGSKFTVVIPQK
jgi:signal transduction histidine kinase